MERLWARDRLLAGRRVVIRATELLWDVCCWMYRRAMEIRVGPVGRDNADGDAAPPTSLSPEETSASRGPDSVCRGGTAGCRSEVCRYCRAVEKTLLWENLTVIVKSPSLHILILLNVMWWTYDLWGIPASPILLKFLDVYFVIQVMTAFNFMDMGAPAAERSFGGRVRSSLRRLWKSLRKMRSEQPGLHCAVLCLVAFGLWFLAHLNLSTLCTIYWGGVLVILILHLLHLKLPDKVSEYFKSQRGIIESIKNFPEKKTDISKIKHWQCNSEIEDEFLPIVTEANLQVLNRVGETGDHSPTPTSVRSDTQNDSFYEDFIEGLQEIAFNMPYHGEGSTDGVELSELELSVGENDAEEDGIKFQAGHFEKSSSSSSEEEVFDGKKIIAVSSDESNGDSDFEIIDKEEIAKIEM
ncbi:uncharacterized protein [Temnothorax longispinosus]|uniref:uncharacterized protein isoform X1 n=1 Tax=Temnothorax longispinosus TaxID=300112 RepID=UPI003A996552